MHERVKTKKSQRNSKEYRSVEEYKDAYYPSLKKPGNKKKSDPFEQGKDLARESLEKFRHLLNR